FVTLQAVVTLGLVPLFISAFGNVSLISPWVNLLAIPIFTAVLVPAVLIGCCLLLVHVPLGTWWMEHLAEMMNGMYHALQWSANLSMATWYVPQSPFWAMCLLGVGALLIVLPVLWPMRMCGLLCCLPALLWQPEKLPADAFELAALDVGQGLSLVIRTASHVLVYDTGPKFQGGTDTGALVVLPYLRSLGVRHVDAVMISHGDDDHAGGMRSVAQGLPVKQWMLGPSVGTEQLPQPFNMQRCQQGQHWQWDDVQFEVLYPSSSVTEVSRNNTSCVLRISAAGGSALLLGDAEAPVEQQLVSENRIAPTSIVVAGHHGSRSSSTPELVNAAHAGYVIFSAGYRNRWDFPKADVVERWQMSGARVNSTIDAGAITIRIMPQGIQTPLWYRIPQWHYWQSDSG
ncbi:MAG: DNA internalization-related competence protein ComEC/Rec2, partial [Steroidobacter sp.]